MSESTIDNNALTQIREITNRLQSPILDLATLLSLLSAPLDSISLLPPQFTSYNISPLPRGTVSITRHIPSLQRALLEHIVPTWEIIIREENASLLLEQYFCPDSFYFTSTAAGQVTLLAYSSILSLPLSRYSMGLLARLTKEYPVDRLHSAVFRSGDASSRTSIAWQDCIRDVVAVPAKVANAMEGKADTPHLLDHPTYFNNVSQRCEVLMFSLSTNPSEDNISSITYLLTKLVNLGVFPAAPPTSRSQPSFFMSTLPTVRARLKAAYRHVYANFWSEAILSLPSTFTLQAVVTCLFSSLSELSSGIDSSSHQRALVKREAGLLRQIVGPLKIENQELWDCVSALILGRNWSEGHGRILTCWAAGAGTDAIDQEGLGVLLTKVVDIWSSSDHIRHSLLSQHQHLTSLLLVTVSYLPPGFAQLNALAFSPSFISGIGSYVGHLDNSVRHCGMLVAEIVAERAGKKLDFGDWDGDDAGKPWARKIRQLITARDIDVDVAESGIPEVEGGDIVEISVSSASKNTQNSEPARSRPIVVAAGYDSDDSLTGYASPTSSRSSSPTPSELEEIEKDPTLRVGIKKIPRPVYLAQLGDMVRSAGGLKANDDSHEADRIEMALNCAEELIRKKRDYGTELEENAVNLVYGFVGLQDNFDLKDFETKRQNAVNALVSCCPRKAAPCIIEEFFKNQYSTSQRYLMLNALALGARELASLPGAPAIDPMAKERISFPSKVLPTKRHQQYLVAGNQDHHVIHQLLDGIAHDAIDRGKDSGADKVPQLVRERQLRIRKPTKITELTQKTEGMIRSPPVKQTTFTTLAAEFFIMPLVNRFWLFLRDEQVREERTAHRETLHRYRGAGTGLILNPVVLAHLLGTLALLVHAAQNAPEWLAVVAPDALELAVTLGTRPVSQMDDEGDANGPEASVLTTALELALVVLDGCLQLDGGRALGLEHTVVLLGAGEWAGSIFGNLEKGVRIVGGGSAEVKLKRAAAGVLLKVDEVTSKWRRSMVDIR